MDNRSHDETEFDVELLGPEIEDLQGLDFDLSLTGFNQHEIDDFLLDLMWRKARTPRHRFPNRQFRVLAICGSVAIRLPMLPIVAA